MTRMAATTGTTRLRFANMMRIASSAVNSTLVPRDGAIVPETTRVHLYDGDWLETVRF